MGRHWVGRATHWVGGAVQRSGGAAHRVGATANGVGGVCFSAFSKLSYTDNNPEFLGNLAEHPDLVPGQSQPLCDDGVGRVTHHTLLQWRQSNFHGNGQDGDKL